MTDEELQVVRERVARYHREVIQSQMPPSVGKQTAAGADLQALLAEVDFLRALIRDLKQDSTGYRCGVEDCLQLLLEFAENNQQEARKISPVDKQGRMIYHNRAAVLRDAAAIIRQMIR